VHYITMRDRERKYLSYISSVLPTYRRYLHWDSVTIPQSNTIRIAHDASTHGFGWAVEDTGSALTHLAGVHRAGVFDGNLGNLSHRSITFLELFAIFSSLLFFNTQLSNSFVYLISDNIADVFILNKISSSSPELTSLLLCITHLCSVYNIRFNCAHIPGKYNIFPDILSRPDHKSHQSELYTKLYSNDLFTQYRTLPHVSKVDGSVWQSLLADLKKICEQL
jgi:hypothetical protein